MHKPPELKPLQFTVGGQTRTADTLIAAAPKRKAAAKKEAPAAYHKGFRVEGHPAGALERAHASNVKAWRDWDDQTPDRRIAELRAGLRPPEMWDENRWRLNTKKRPVRSKPFVIASAADQCAELARKAGWIDVIVVELKAGASAGMLFGDAA